MRDDAFLLRIKRSTRVRTRGLELVERSRSRTELLRERTLRERYAHWRTQPIQERAVLYESFSGNGALCNPEAIFRHLLDAPDMSDLHHVWALDDLGEKHSTLLSKFADDHRVSFVQVGSSGYLKALATSKYLINNATFPPEFAKRDGQVYLNTWHGVPLKHMGYDVPGGGSGSRNILRNLVAADYLISSSPFMTETMYRNAYRLQGVYRGAVIEEGQPRTDRQHSAESDPAPVLDALASANLDTHGRQIILFAPTWKGESFQDPHVNAEQLVAVVRELQKRVDASRYVVLLKVHQTIHEAVAESGKASDLLIPNELPTNSILGVTEVLVTDYSSIFFDFLASGRPVLHYIPDLDEYTAGRGLYLDEAELFGPTSRTVAELAEQVGRLDADLPHRAPAYVDAVRGYAPRDDGRVSERVVDIVFRGRTDGYNLKTDFSNNKRSILIYLGSLASMGITTSALNLLKNLDYDRFDVSVFYHPSLGPDRAKNEALIDPRVRLFPRVGKYIGSPSRLAREQRVMSRGLPASPPAGHQRFWEDEWRRMFGMCQFDSAVDFSGYGTFCPFLFTAATNSEKSLWLHSDLMADSQRDTGGRKHLEGRLNAVFTTFRYFDHLVSVSKELNSDNAAKLAAFASPEKFTYASNTIDQERVLTMAGLNTSGERVRSAEATFETSNVASAVSSLLEHFDSKLVLREARTRARMSHMPVRGGSTVTFAAVGRLSSEKNHARLIRAFSQVHQNHPHTRLVIMGSGPLMGNLGELVESLGLEDYVSLTGQVDNPYAIMAESDCFVVSSVYEGQPMVVLEARTLDLPIVTTAFSSVSGSVPPGAGLIVEQSDEALAEGMEQFLAGKVPSKRLDWDSYNATAMQQFYRAIGAEAGD